MKFKIYIQNLLNVSASYYRFICGLVEDDKYYYIWDFESCSPKDYCVLEKDCYKVWLCSVYLP